ncbi:MAG: UPF0158 family protein [Gammaproteobacteria bacterium]
MIKAKFSEILDAIEFHSDLSESVINIKTGEVHTINEEAIGAIEEGDDENEHSDWMREEIKIAKHYLENPDDYLTLPSQRDADDYQMMEDFAEGLEDEMAANQLLIALRGKGAFRRFKDSVILLGIDKDWYKFRDERYKQFVLQWCEDNGITLCDEAALNASTN